MVYNIETDNKLRVRRDASVRFGRVKLEVFN
jgi:hypothetical protein